MAWPWRLAFSSGTWKEIRSDIDEEKNQVLRALGIEPDFKSQAAEMVNPIEAMFDFLPEAKKVQVLRLMTDLQANMAKAMEGSGQPDHELLAKLQKEMDQAILQLC